MLTATTELQAINIMLGTIGESPINSLDAGSAVADSAIARELLKEVSIQVQEEGWHFNTEKVFSLYPNINTGEIVVPVNCIQCDTVERDVTTDVSVRGNRLYNRTEHTYVFTKPVKVDMIILLEFEELPQAARHYITIRASRIFQRRVVGSQLLEGMTASDEAIARTSLKKLDSRTGDYNILTGSYSVMRTLNR